MVSKFFIGFGLAFWASIIVTGYFVLKLVWDLDSISVHPGHALVTVTLALFWLAWLLVGGIFGAVSLVEGFED